VRSVQVYTLAEAHAPVSSHLTYPPPPPTPWALMCSYIKWAQEQCAAAGGAKAELMAVLEAATRALTASNRYNDDVRLLRIWVQYVSQCKRSCMRWCCCWCAHPAHHHSPAAAALRPLHPRASHST
jgi:Mad3/BUB1 homology region 1